MPTYAALLRGIGPANPNMRNEHLRRVFEDLGFQGVRSVISSGNIVFESDDTDPAAMETLLEEAWPRGLGFRSTTIIRSEEQFAALADADPFAGLEHGAETYLLVTFFKHPPEIDLTFPYEPPGASFRVVGYVEGGLATVTDATDGPTPDAVAWVEKQFGKETTSRSWLTVHRILKKMNT